MEFGILNSDFIDYHDADDLPYESKKLIRAANMVLGNCLLINPSKVESVVKDGEAKLLYQGENNKGDIEILNKLDVILVRRTRGFSEEMYDIIDTVDSFTKKPLISDIPESFNRPTSKITSILERLKLFKQANTQIIFNLQNTIKHVEIDFPVIVKPTHGFKGRKIKICNNLSEVNEFIKEISNEKKSRKDIDSLGYGVFVQEFIEFDEEYRVNVIGGKAVGCVVKVSEKAIKNADQGATFMNQYNETVINIAEQVAQVHKLTFAGADIARKGEDYYLIECNRNPAFEEFDSALNHDTARDLIIYLYNKAKKEAEIAKKRKERKERKMKKESKSDRTTTIIINNSTGIQIGDENTQNNNQVFDDIKIAIKSEITDSSEREEILKKLQNLESSIGNSDSFSNYQDFIASAANHMTVLAPLLPALTQLVQ